MSNFEFLKSFNSEMFGLSQKAEQLFVEGDYKLATHIIRDFMEAVVSFIEKKEMYSRQKNMPRRLDYILRHNYFNNELRDRFKIVWEWASDASHNNCTKVHDKHSTTARLQDIFFIARWLYNRSNVNKIRDDFDLTKLEEKQEPVVHNKENKEYSSNIMTKFVKHFFNISAVNGPSEETVGNSGVLEIKVDNRAIPYMVLLRKFQDKISNALYPAIYIYKNFGVAFTVYGIGGYCQENWPEQTEKEKPTIESYFKESGHYDDVLRQNPKYNYFDNRYEGVYRLDNLDAAVYEQITNDFEHIRVELKKTREA
jgi:hypothetical protein